MAARLRLVCDHDEAIALECELLEEMEAEFAIVAVWQEPHVAEGKFVLEDDKKSARCRVLISQVQMDAVEMGIIIILFKNRTQKVYPLLRRILVGEGWIGLEGLDSKERLNGRRPERGGVN